jgi:hypothetical protein
MSRDGKNTFENPALQEMHGDDDSFLPRSKVKRHRVANVV